MAQRGEADDGMFGCSSVDSMEDSERVGLLSEQRGRVRLVSGGTVTVDVVTGSSWYASVFLVVNAALGAGLLNFPAAYDKSGGLMVAILVQAALMVFIVGALVILAFCSDLQHSATYQDTVYSMCGRVGQIVCALCIALYCFGTCITFFIIIADQLDKFLTFVHGPDYCLTWYMNRSFTMTSSCVLLVLPLCFPKRIDFLKYASALGVVSVVYCVILVTVKYFISDIQPGPIKTTPTTWTDVFLVVPVICFGYQCHVSFIPIYSCMRERNLKDLSKTIFVSLAVCIFAYTGTASFGYLTFGSRVNEDILLSYRPTPDVLLAVVLIAAKMYTTYPLLLFVGRAAVDGLWVRLRGLDPEAEQHGERLRRIILTLIWFATSLLLAVFLPNIGLVISVLGGLASAFIFLFPGVCLLQVLLGGHMDAASRLVYRVLFTMAVTYLVIGGFLLGVTTAQALLTDLHSTTHSQTNKYGCL